MPNDSAIPYGAEESVVIYRLMEHVLEALPWIVGIMAFMMIKLVRVFTYHQQRMTEILNKTSADRGDIASLRQEIAELKSLVNESVIASDDRRRISVPPPAPDLGERLRSKA
ncbi:MAG: hypothetical protein ACHQ50_01510 [Fimbriimonadales bacterium]